MSETEQKTLPPGWVEVTLGDIMVNSSTTIDPRRYPDERFSLYSVPSFETDKPETVIGSDIGSSKQTVIPGTVLLCKINPRINRVWIVDERTDLRQIASTEWIPFFPVIDLRSKYLSYYLQQNDFRDYLAHHASGVGGSLMRVKPSTFQDYQFVVAPAKEQDRIVEELEKQFSRLDAGVAALKRVKAGLKRYRASVLQAACEGRLVPTEAELARTDGRDYEPASELLKRILAERRAKWEADQLAKMQSQGKSPKDDKWKLKYKEPTPPDTSELPELPEGWCWASAEQICDFITKGTTPSAEKLHAGSGDIPYIKVYNLTTNGVLDFTINPTFIDETTHKNELVRSQVYPGDILMNIVGPPLGKVSVVPDSYPEWNINQAISFFRPMPSYDRKFLCQILLTESTLRWAIKRAKATAGQFNLTLEICRSLPVPVPPLVEQHRIAAEVESQLSVVEKLDSAIESNLRRAERLRQSILKLAFEGKLVPQDPNDEPAGMLLKKIKKEHL